ncbi:hypothetical protein B0J12DRAFT_404344 [Macrophomina phaseolina]|uniref:Uncharacterized protein n=1 Tax=Macrophomina phaseolina TaxID=35725 RepID=A0ABQ8GJE8_9PEZI|nr:hypothetical protein B0J12DRAFT_404344 [Macrophomina phaseolina]
MASLHIFLSGQCVLSVVGPVPNGVQGRRSVSMGCFAECDHILVQNLDLPCQLSNETAEKENSSAPHRNIVANRHSASSSITVAKRRRSDFGCAKFADAYNGRCCA